MASVMFNNGVLYSGTLQCLRNGTGEMSSQDFSRMQKFPPSFQKRSFRAVRAHQQIGEVKACLLVYTKNGSKTNAEDKVRTLKKESYS